MDRRLSQVEFIPDSHEYWYTEGNIHKQLHGVTTPICKLMNKNFPDTDIVKLTTLYGHDVHAESENWIKKGKLPSTEAGKWLIQTLENIKLEYNIESYEAELLVSDLEGTASKIDIVMHTVDGAYIFDIKTTSKFDRAYCSLQLSCYKRMYEANYGEKVLGMFVLGTKSRRTFRIIEQEDAKVQKILDMNKGV